MCIAAIPAEENDFARISSGTWSIVGDNVPEAMLCPKALEFNLTNEGGLGGTFRFSKNVMGLWLVQECHRAWAIQGEELSYGELALLAEAADEDAAFSCERPMRCAQVCSLVTYV